MIHKFKGLKLWNYTTIDSNEFGHLAGI